MKEQLISFKTAKLALQKGYDDTFYDFECIPLEHDSYHEVADNRCYRYSELNGTGKVHLVLPAAYKKEYGDYNFICVAPTQSLLQRWLREEHKINVIVQPFRGKWSVMVYDKDLYNPTYHGSDTRSEFANQFNLYEEALEKGLEESLKLI